MQILCKFLVALATLAILTSVGNCFKLIDENIAYPFNENFNYSEIRTKWVLNAVIPSYLKDFGAIYNHHLTQQQNDAEFSVQQVTKDFLDKVLGGVSSESCRGHVTEWWTRFNLANPDLVTEKDEWVLQMVDAWGKLPEGILSGHVGATGDFDQCIQIKVNDLEIVNDIYPELNVEKKFVGKYCTSYLVDYTTSMSMTPKRIGANVINKDNAVQAAVSLKELVLLILGKTKSFGKVIPSVAVCMPDSCSDSDIQQLLVNGLNLTYSDNNATYDPSGVPWPMTMDCVVSEKPALDGAAISVIVLLAILVTLTLTAGIVDYWYDDGSKGKKAPKGGVLYQYFMAFSFYTNTKSWLSTRRGSEDLGCLHGIRFFSMAWVVLLHTFTNFTAGPQWNQIDIQNSYKKWTLLVVLNGSFCVDTFFLMSGMLATYSILKMLDKTKGKFNIIMFYVHRYIRLTPPYAIFVGIAATLFSYAGNGPSWAFFDAEQAKCRKNWWASLLYVNNLLPDTYQMCHGVSWYLANDMQFYVISPLIVYPIWKKERLGLVLLTIYSIMACIAPVLVVRYAKDAPPAQTVTNRLGMGEGLTEIYDRPWSRVNVFLVGIWLGWLLHKTRGKRVVLPRVAVLGLWLTSTGIALALLFGIYPWFIPDHNIPTVSGYFYAGLSRFSWGVVVSCVIFACIKGYGGIVNRFLSWKVFMPLGRLTYCVYLIHIYLQHILHYRLNIPIKWDAYFVINIFLAHLTMSFLVGFVTMLVIESPFVVIHKLIFDGKVGVPKKPKEMNKLAEEAASTGDGNNSEDKVTKINTD